MVKRNITSNLIRYHTTDLIRSQLYRQVCGCIEYQILHIYRQVQRQVRYQVLEQVRDQVSDELKW
jgi:hypothetical protein